MYLKICTVHFIPVLKYIIQPSLILLRNIETIVKLLYQSFFQCNLGTRQGDKTSSTIFALLIDELSVMLRETCGSGIFISNEIPDILCLMFTDDIASCAETAFKLQQQLNVVYRFCMNTGMKINLDKTEIIVLEMADL